MEQLDYNILFRWFVGLEMDEPVWVPTVFTKTETGCCNTPSRTASSSAWWHGRPI